MSKEWLYGKTLAELGEVAANAGAKPFVAKQIADWIYKKEIREIALMSNLSVTLREKLSENYVVGVFEYKDVQESTDGTKKYLFPTAGGNYIESAYIPEEDR
ncbi:MAG: 23S rRNA (adenine(2503)-C(2))-methyltransferase RlmN, partial [Rikenellaceae bacterium]